MPWVFVVSLINSDKYNVKESKNLASPRRVRRDSSLSAYWHTARQLTITFLFLDDVLRTALDVPFIV